MINAIPTQRRELADGDFTDRHLHTITHRNALAHSGTQAHGGAAAYHFGRYAHQSICQ